MCNLNSIFLAARQIMIDFLGKFAPTRDIAWIRNKINNERSKTMKRLKNRLQDMNMISDFV